MAKILKITTISLGILFLLIISLIIATFALVKHTKIKDLVEHEIETELGINVTIESLDYSPLLTSVRAKGITIQNPKGFDEKELAYLNSIQLVWDLGDLIIHKKPSIYLACIDLERLNIVKNKEGRYNLKELIPIKNPKAAAKDEAPFSFNILMLSVDKVSYTEYVKSGKKTRLFNIHMKNQVFAGLKDEDEVVKMVIHNAIQNTDIAKTVNPILGSVSGTVDMAWGTAKTGAKSAFQIISLPFNLIFGK